MSARETIRKQWRSLVLVGAGCVALLGAGCAALDLLRGIGEANSLFAIGIAGLSMEGDLQDYTQQSRRTFVYALTTKDPNLQLPFIQQARAAEKRVRQLSSDFQTIAGESGSAAELARFIREWKAYLAVRDEVIALILEGSPEAALAIEKSQGVGAFEACANSMKQIKRILDTYAEHQLARIRHRYIVSAVELALLMLTMLLFMASFRKLAALRKTNKGLEEAELLERERSVILELIGENRPLPEVISALARMVERQHEGVCCAISLLKDGVLSFVAAPSLPPEYIRVNDHAALADCMTSCGSAARTGSVAARVLLDEPPCWPALELLAPLGIRACWSVPIHSARHEILGTIGVFSRQSRTPREEELMLLSRIARLAALGIEHREVIDRLAFQAQHDPLTDLPNRAMFQNLISEALINHNGHDIAVLWVDLDRFKQVNDLFGHHVGDSLLQAVARRLQRCVRTGDVVARLGGDEFVILLLSCFDSDATPLALAERVVRCFEEPFTILQNQISVTASVGLSRCPDDGENAESLLRNADTAMYRAKFHGKNMCEMYRPEMGFASSDRLAIEKHLPGALQNAEFELYYQPQINLSGSIGGVEALIRWNSPILGPVSPVKFIPIAEEIGLIVPIGNWVLQTACAEAASWHAARSSVRISVNVSPNQFVRSDFAAMVQSCLTGSGLDPTLLELEITETAVMRRVDDSLRQLKTLRKMGVSISIDDFGTGNSSLSYLRQLPVDTLKIDRSFIKDIDSAGHESLSVVRAIIGLAHGLRLSVVAEGVENQDQLTILAQEQCDLIQGYFFHKPMPRDAFRKVLKMESRGESVFPLELLLLEKALTSCTAEIVP